MTPPPRRETGARTHRYQAMHDESTDNRPPSVTADPPLNEDTATAHESDCARTRRGFLGGSARKLAYAAPVVLLFKPEPACASVNGSQITQG